MKCIFIGAKKIQCEAPFFCSFNLAIFIMTFGFSPKKKEFFMPPLIHSDIWTPPFSDSLCSGSRSPLNAVVCKNSRVRVWAFNWMLYLIRNQNDKSFDNPSCDKFIHCRLWFPAISFCSDGRDIPSGYKRNPQEYPHWWFGFPFFANEEPQGYMRPWARGIPSFPTQTHSGESRESSSATVILCNIGRWGLGQGWI